VDNLKRPKLIETGAGQFAVNIGAACFFAVFVTFHAGKMSQGAVI
jgi:hypothetical protein